MHFFPNRSKCVHEIKNMAECSCISQFVAVGPLLFENRAGRDGLALLSIKIDI